MAIVEPELAQALAAAHVVLRTPGKYEGRRERYSRFREAANILDRVPLEQQQNPRWIMMKMWALSVYPGQYNRFMEEFTDSNDPIILLNLMHYHLLSIFGGHPQFATWLHRALSLSPRMPELHLMHVAYLAERLYQAEYEHQIIADDRIDAALASLDQAEALGVSPQVSSELRASLLILAERYDAVREILPTVPEHGTPMAEGKDAVRNHAHQFIINTIIKENSLCDPQQMLIPTGTPVPDTGLFRKYESYLYSGGWLVAGMAVMSIFINNATPTHQLFLGAAGGAVMVIIWLIWTKKLKQAVGDQQHQETLRRNPNLQRLILITQVLSVVMFIPAVDPYGWEMGVFKLIDIFILPPGAFVFFRKRFIVNYR